MLQRKALARKVEQYCPHLQCLRIATAWAADNKMGRGEVVKISQSICYSFTKLSTTPPKLGALPKPSGLSPTVALIWIHCLLFTALSLSPPY